MKKIALLATLPALLSACGLPTAVVMTTYAVDGVTYVSTGKSLSGHALSAATDKDCSILFGITRGELCRNKEPLDEQATHDASFRVPKDSTAARDGAATTPAYGQSAAMQPVPEPRFYDFEYEAPPAPAATAKSAAGPKSSPAANLQKPDSAHPTEWTLVLGSFADYRSANELARRVKPEPGLVSAINIGGEVRYLVATRPLKRDQPVGPQLDIASLNLDTVKLMPVCPAAVRNDNCVTLGEPSTIQQATLP